MTVKVFLTNKEEELANSYAKSLGLPLDEAMKRVFFEAIEDEYDSQIADKAMKEYEENPKTYSLKELI